MTIENMNHLKLVPHKDYTANRLVSGLLQLPSNTSLVVDETLLEQGQLDAPGACMVFPSTSGPWEPDLVMVS